MLRGADFLKSKKLFPLMSEHTARLSIPVSFAVRCDSVTDLGSKE